LPRDLKRVLVEALLKPQFWGFSLHLTNYVIV
jgi:hypothetical protein